MTSDDKIRADLEHLRDLWDLLPGESETSFWEQVSDAENGGTDDGYFVRHVQMVRRNLESFLAAGNNRPGETRLQTTVQYVLMFFDRDDEALFKALDRVVGYPPTPPGRAGKRWAEDACATAWRLYVPARASGLH